MLKRLRNGKSTRSRIGEPSPMTFWRWRKAGKFPEPDAIINGRNYWLDSTIDEYIDQALESQAGEAA